MGDFNLRDLIREHLATSPDPNPHNIADEVARAVPSRYLREALADALQQTVVIMASMSRNQALTKQATGFSAGGRAAAVKTYKGLLSERMSVGAGVWKLLGDCTKDDLEYVAEVRQAHAEQNAMWADRYRHLAKRMNATQKVADLPRHVVEDALQ